MRQKPVFIGAAMAGAFFVGGAAVATVSEQQTKVVESIDRGDIAVASSMSDSVGSTNNTPVTVEPATDDSNSSPVSVPDTNTTASSGGARAAIVPGLAERSGVLRLDDDDFYFGRLELDFGPEKWLMTTTATTDLNGDRVTGTWWDELVGLVGREVTVLGDVDDDDIDVFQVNGATLRPIDRPAPWSGQVRDDDDDDAVPTNTAITVEEAKRIALEQVPGVVYAVELDSDDGIAYWEIEIRANDGALYDVEIDADSGRVIEVDRD